MSSITIRGVDEDLSKLLKKTAKESQMSLNQLVLDILRKSLGLDKEKRFTQEYTDLDHLFGRWTQAQFEQIQGKINRERNIDEELWK